MKPDAEFSWYRKQIAKYGVDHPQSVGNTHETREEAIQELADRYETYAIASPNTVLEIGMGNMLVTDAFHRNGTPYENITGVEVVPEFADYCERRGVKVCPTNPTSSFDYSLVIGMFSGFDTAGCLTLLDEVVAITRNQVILGFQLNAGRGYRKPDIRKFIDHFGDSLYLQLINGYCTGTIDAAQFRLINEEAS